MWPVLVLMLLFPAASQAQGLSEEFEDDTLGLLPGSWLDVRLFSDPLNQPNPSAVVVQTTGPSGGTTQALETVAALPVGQELFTQGIYRKLAPGPISHYRAAASVRIDQYSDTPVTVLSDWPMAVGFVNTSVVDPPFAPDFCCIQSMAIFASSLTQGWRLFVITPNKAFDFDLGAPASAGTWYRVELELDPASGTVTSRVTDLSSNTVLVDRTDNIDSLEPTQPPWDPLVDGVFGHVAFYEGEASASNNTIANVAVIDDLKWEPAELLVCDPELTQASYINGETVTVDTLRLANLGTSSAAIELKAWFEVPGGSPISILNFGANGSFVLPPGLDVSLGPLPLQPVTAALPRGNWEFDCRLVDPVTGAELALDVNGFEIQ